MQKIIPHLWFDKEAKEASAFYTTIFPDSKILQTRTITDTPSGDCDIVSFSLWGTPFMAISAGPYFTMNPSISFLVNFDPARTPDAETLLQTIWDKLADGGTPLMPLSAYPFSKKYGWVKDKFGLTWQLMLTNPDGEERPPILPYIMFTGTNAGRAAEASDFYRTVFTESRRGTVMRHPEGSSPDKPGTIMFTDFQLGNTWFAAMDSAYPHEFALNEAISFLVHCDTQEEIDYYWSKLSTVPEAEQCGWCKDQFGVSWQIIPTMMDDMMANGTAEQRNRVTQAFLRMKKFDIPTLESAYRTEK